jgi:hypothetical protein
MMAKPTRSPVLGFNHNLKYRGRIFHVQTEDSGPGNPRIFTHLYFGGTILASKKHEYDPAAAEDVVRALMQSQHKSILKELKGSRHDERISAFFAARGESLDGAVVAAVDALDLDAAPEIVRPTPVAPQPTFADTFDDEPTTPDQPKPSAGVEGAGVPSAHPGLPPHEPSEIPLAARTSPVPLPRTDSPTGRRPARATPAMGAPVVVQRTVAVGGTGTFGRPVARGRKPAPAIPYVVKEGTHPLAEAQTPPPLDLPPAQALTPPPVTAANASITSALPGRMPAPAPIEKSLDEVILAYLAQGGEHER